MAPQLRLQRGARKRRRGAAGEPHGPAVDQVVRTLLRERGEHVSDAAVLEETEALVLAAKKRHRMA